MTFERWEFPASVIDTTQSTLRRGKHEVFVLWAGPRPQHSSVCRVTRLIVPEQTPESSKFGESVRIAGAELARIQFDNFERGEKNYVQIHTHPSPRVDMSDLDREREVVNYTGALSIIVPQYCAGDLAAFSGVNVYEREDDGWRLWSSKEVAERIHIV